MRRGQSLVVWAIAEAEKQRECGRLFANEGDAPIGSAGLQRTTDGLIAHVETELARLETQQDPRFCSSELIQRTAMGARERVKTAPLASAPKSQPERGSRLYGP